MQATPPQSNVSSPAPKDLMDTEPKERRDLPSTYLPTSKAKTISGRSPVAATRRAAWRAARARSLRQRTAHEGRASRHASSLSRPTVGTGGEQLHCVRRVQLQVGGRDAHWRLTFS
eukprot:6212248-Pleurochrysis_carterae.AAC.7